MNPLNDLSTMNKTMEYMAFELPVVAFDLRETRVSAADAAVYVQPTGNPDQDVRDYAQAIVDLIDNGETRARMSKLGRARVEEALAWPYQRQAYLGVYARLAPLTAAKPGS
jgi:glycosyltransferase involved in cell wall biosynthesis